MSLSLSLSESLEKRSIGSYCGWLSTNEKGESASNFLKYDIKSLLSKN